MTAAENALFQQLEDLYCYMDEQWNRTADKYGFQCNGCNENCCETEFHHHTHIEKAYLLHGFNKLPRPTVVSASKRAKKVNSKRNLAAKKGEKIRMMCPVNLDEKCILYPFRPMICRLHGIPHEVDIPGASKRKTLQKPGCDAGAPLFEGIYHPFDRTPFYSQMAALEKAYCALKFPGKPQRIKQTIAQMLVK